MHQVSNAMRTVPESPIFAVLALLSVLLSASCSLGSEVRDTNDIVPVHTPGTSPAPHPNDERGVVNPRTGEYLPPSGRGVVNPRTGDYYFPAGNGYFNPKTGEFIPEKH
jgi:hypothetical protein